LGLAIQSCRNASSAFAKDPCVSCRFRLVALLPPLLPRRSQLMRNRTLQEKLLESGLVTVVRLRPRSRRKPRDWGPLFRKIPLTASAKRTKRPKPNDFVPKSKTKSQTLSLQGRLPTFLQWPKPQKTKIPQVLNHRYNNGNQ